MQVHATCYNTMSCVGYCSSLSMILQEMMEFLQTRDGLDGTTLRRKLSMGKDSVDSMPVQCKGMLARKVSL